MNILKYIFSREYRGNYRKKMKLKNFKEEFIKLNPKSLLIFDKIMPLDLVKCGKYSYSNGLLNLKRFNVKNEKLEIGNYCSIAENVTFILSGGHYTDTFTTYPFKTKCFNEKESETLCKGPIKICDDVWIGYGAIILSGVTIGQGAVVGTGSVVTKDVEPYSIVGGNPAKLIRYRYPKELRNEMMKIDFSKIEPEDLKEIKNLIYEKLDLEKLKKIRKYLK